MGHIHIVFSKAAESGRVDRRSQMYGNADDRWYKVEAALRVLQLVSELGFFLMREDDAVNYSGDGKSGLEIAAIALA